MDGRRQQPCPWTDDQWNRVRRVVYEEARAARVAGNLLPLYGPLGAGGLVCRERSAD